MKTIRDIIAANFSVYVLIMVLGGLVAFYAFVFIPMNERQINNHMDRLLANKAKTALEKYNGYKRAIESTPIAYVINRAFMLTPEEDVIYLLPPRTEGSLIYYGFNHQKMQDKVDSLGRCEEKIITIHRKDLDSSAVDPSLKGHVKGGTKFNQEQNLWQVSSGNYHFVYEPDEDFYNTDSSRVLRHYLWLSVKGFTQNIKETDFFDDLFLVATDTTGKKKKEIQEGRPEAGAVLDLSLLGLVRFDIPDTIRKIGTGFFYKKIADQTFAIYLKEIKLRRNLSVYLVGLIEKSKLVTKAREVPAWFVVFSSLIALLLIFSMPIIKLFSINKSERLLSRDARLAVFSMILTISLATILLAGSYLFWGLERNGVDDSLKDIASKIETLATRQVSDAVSALSDEKIFDDKSGRSNLSSHNVTNYNEVIRVGINGTVKKVYGENGIDYLTEKFPIKLGSREYVKKPKAAFENNLEADYFLQALNSYSSGRAEVGISRLCREEKEVAVITSRLPAIINATIPSPFHFVVTDKKGEVKFNSRWEELQIENFISECNENASLAGHIRLGVTGYIDFTYLGSDCSGYGKPILKDWYLIVYRELSTTKNLAAEVFGLSLLTLALVTLTIGLIHICLLADRKKSTILLARDFIYHWLNPFAASSSMWIRLAFFCLLLFLAEMTWSYFFFSTISSIFFVLICITLFYVVVYFSLNQQSHENKNLSPGMKWLIALLIFWSIGLVAVIVTDKQWQTLILLIPFAVIVWLFGKNSHRFFTKVSGFKHYLYYRFFLISSLMVIAVGPSILFLSNHYYFTSISVKYHFLVEDLVKLQIHDSNYKRELQGNSYIDSSLHLTEPIREDTDSLFYAFIQSLQPQTPSLASINMGLLPNDSGFESFHDHESLTVVAPTSTLIQSSTMRFSRMLENLRWVNNNSSYAIILVALTGTAGLWYLLLFLPRKIFFAPDLIVWKCFEETNAPDFLEQEFENDSDPRHPLYEFSVHEKANLRASRDSKKDFDADPDAFRDRLVLQIQEQASDLYETVWRRCSDEEKYFLYDLASDGIANQVDQVLIGKLAEKGLIRLRPHLKPVNVSFANYVLKAMTEDEMSKWKEKESTEGNWQNLKWMLLISIAAVFIFLSVAEENFLGRVTTIVGSIGLFVPQLMNIITSVGGIFKKG